MLSLHECTNLLSCSIRCWRSCQHFPVWDGVLWDIPPYNSRSLYLERVSQWLASVLSFPTAPSFLDLRGRSKGWAVNFIGCVLLLESFSYLLCCYHGIPWCQSSISNRTRGGEQVPGCCCEWGPLSRSFNDLSLLEGQGGDLSCLLYRTGVWKHSFGSACWYWIQRMIGFWCLAFSA